MALTEDTVSPPLSSAWKRIILFQLAVLGVLIVAGGLNDWCFQRLGDPERQIVTYLLILGLTLFVFRYFACHVDRRPLAAYGFHFDRTWGRQFVLGLGWGLLSATWPFFPFWAMGWLQVVETFHVEPAGSPFWLGIVVGLIRFTCGAVAEEIIFRGHPMKNLVESWRVPPTWGQLLCLLLGPAVWFTAYHFPRIGSSGMFSLLGFGILVACLYYATGSLAAPIGAHLAANFVQAHLLGLSSETAACFLQMELVSPTRTVVISGWLAFGLLLWALAPVVLVALCLRRLSPARFRAPLQTRKEDNHDAADRPGLDRVAEAGGAE